MHIILTLGDQLSGSKSLTSQQVAVTLQAYWQHIRADLETKIILSGGRINDRITNAALMEDIARHPKKYNINAKRIPKCDLILEEKSTNICGNILHAVNKVRRLIDSIKQISIITTDNYLSQVAKTFGVISSVYNDSAPDEGTQKYEFPIYKIIACNTLEEYSETQQVANEVYYTDKFLAECKNTMINPNHTVKKSFAHMMNIINRHTRDSEHPRKFVHGNVANNAYVKNNFTVSEMQASYVN